MSTRKARLRASRAYYARNREAEKERTKKWRKENQEWYESYVKKNKKKFVESARKHDHQATPEWFENSMREQKGKCAICRKKLIRPDIDHDRKHCPGRKSCVKCNRGLLCRSCNTFIGLAKESEKILRNAIQYLKKWRTNGHQA